MTMMEILLGASDEQLEKIEFERSNIGNTEAMMKLINKALSIEDFTKQCGSIPTATNSNVNVYWLVATWLDDEYLWCNSWAIMITQDILWKLFSWYLEYLIYKREWEELFAEWDVVSPIVAWDTTNTIIWLPIGNYKVLKLWASNLLSGSKYTGNIKFYKAMQIVDINNNNIVTINSPKLFYKTEFDWKNVERERVRMKVKPVVEQMILKDKDTAYSDYEVAMQNIIKATRRVEAVNNEKNMDEYIDTILSNISSSLVRLKESDMIQTVAEKDSFKYSILTTPIKCNNNIIWQYVISIDMIWGNVSMKHAWLWSDITPHPHVRNNGYCCWWWLTNNVVEWLKLWNISLVVECCIALLQSYNPTSSYVPLESVINNVKQTIQYRDLVAPKTYWDDVVMFKSKMPEWEANTLAPWATSLLAWHQVYSVII